MWLWLSLTALLYHQSGDLAGMTPRWLFSFRTVLIFGMGSLFCIRLDFF